MKGIGPVLSDIILFFVLFTWLGIILLFSDQLDSILDWMISWFI